ncbi:MAG: DUF1648 domain-containing protein [Treponema sp.]|nr:DUF1648 domain-containing protein [Treponema sp.]
MASKDKKGKIITLIITTLICLTPIILGVALWERLPDELPGQYGFNDQVNWTAPKWVNVFILPIFIALMNLIMNIIAIKQSENITSKKLNALVVLIIPVMSIIINPFMILKPLGLQIEAYRVVIPLISVILILSGNYMPKTKPNKYIGARFSAALKDEKIWAKSQRFVGAVFVICGFVSLIFSFFPIGRYVFIGAFIIMSVITTFYTIYVSRKYKNNSSVKKGI